VKHQQTQEHANRTLRAYRERFTWPHRLITALVALLCLAFGLARPPAADAQTGIPCGERRALVDWIWVDPTLVCPERVFDDDSGGMAFTGLAVDDEDQLYAARPWQGEVVRFQDSDDDGIPDSPEIVARDLVLPHALAWYADALYVVGASYLYRLQDGSTVSIRDDLPTGLFWTSAIAIGEDERIYIATSTPCDPCSGQETASGIITSYTLDGKQEQVIARGLYHPGDLAFFQGTLWVSDTAPNRLSMTADLDEINRITQDAHFGFPLCFGAAQVDLTDAFCLTQTTFPAASLPTQATPLGMAAYRGSAIPALQDTLIVALSGSEHSAALHGYAVIGLRYGDEGELTDAVTLVPRDPSGVHDTAALNYRNSGFYPRRPLDIAVSHGGIVYLSISGGRILALRG
jgi:glucose/arabinose dehydrogenase